MSTASGVGARGQNVVFRVVVGARESRARVPWYFAVTPALKLIRMTPLNVPMERRFSLRSFNPDRGKAYPNGKWIVLARFKDGYRPVGAWFLLLKAYATNAHGESMKPPGSLRCVL